MHGRASTAGNLPVHRTHHARRCAYYNGAAWAVGNGLASGTLVTYLALELGADAKSIGLILAAPRLAGLLRLAAPTLIAWSGNRKRFCVASYLASTLVLMLLPLAAWRVDWLPAEQAVAVLVATWCVYHLLEYLATVALWSWLADLVPRRIRGRFLGRRERWMVLGQAAAMIVAGLHTWGWLEQYPHLPRPTAYALPALVGAVVMALSILPLAAIASVPTRSLASIPLRRLLAPLTDPCFRRLLLFGCWFSFFNGVTQSAQGMFPYRVLGVGMFTMLLLKTGMRTGQWSLGPWVGRVADRIGNRPVMLLALPIVATGPLCYLFAGRAPEATPGGVPLAMVWLTTAWVAWVAYVGLNVCLPNLMLNLAPREDNTPHIAGYYALTGLLTALATLAGGWLFDRFETISWTVVPGAAPLDIYQCSFLFGWLTRTAGVLLLWRIIEPGRPRRK